MLKVTKLATTRRLTLLCLVLSELCTNQLARADSELNGQIKEVAAHYLQSRITDLQGKTAIFVTEPARSSRLAPCTSLEAFQAPSARRLGRVSVGVRCLAPNTWSIYLAARVSVVAQYVAAASSLRPGQKLSSSDLTVKIGDLGTLPEDVVLTPDRAIDHILIFGIVSGSPLRSVSLREPNAIQQGQPVKLIVNGSGFQVSAEAVALNNASDGQPIKAKTPDGQVVSGIAQSDGTVKLGF
ncbi:MAG: flagellar basal body P-ring formation chaperone FlgA [Thiobacillaceae bacterium]